MIFGDLFGIKAFFSKIDNLLFKREDRALQQLVNNSDVEQLVSVLENIPHGRKKTFNLLAPDKAASVLKNLSPYIRQYVLKGTPTPKVLAIMNNLESDEIADLVKILPGSSRESVMNELRRHDPKNILGLMNLRPDTAGGLMKTEVVVGKPDYTVREFTGILRENFPEGLPRTNFVYIVDDQGRLLGFFNFNKLYLADREMALRELMRTGFRSININEDQEEVARDFASLDAVELPVVDNRGALVGRITADDIIDVLRTEFSEDIYRLVGAYGDQRANDPYAIKVKKRFPWLVINLGTAIIAALVVSQFTDTIGQFVVLAAYMPIIAGMGGNAATQTLGVTIRAIALGEINQINTWKIILKEIFTGMTNGAATGLIMALIAYGINRNLTLSFVIFASMTINLFVAGLGGSIIPLIMKWLKIDPALASAVFSPLSLTCLGF